MNVSIQFEAQLREVAGVSEALLEFPETATLNDALEAVATDRDELRGRLFSNDRVSESLMIFVNEQPVRNDSAADRLLQDGDVILLLPPISGG